MLSIEENNIIGYKYVNIGKMMDAIKAGTDPMQAIEKSKAVSTADSMKQQRLSIRGTGMRRPTKISTFENYHRKIEKINRVLSAYDISSLEDAKAVCEEKGIDPYKIAKEIQPICFEDVCWAYVAGAAIAIKKGTVHASDAARAIGEGLQAFSLPGSVAEDRKVGLGHGNLAAMLLSEETECFAFLAGHESFAAAEGAIGIAKSANKVRTKPLRVILNGLGKDAAQIILKNQRIHLCADTV